MKWRKGKTQTYSLHIAYARMCTTVFFLSHEQYQFLRKNKNYPKTEFGDLKKFSYILKITEESLSRSIRIN